ncbi:MAG: PAS domain-containing protein [Caldisericota bacterium]|nr:PAS domain-containing protein [Caldisericota bacterium]
MPSKEDEAIIKALKPVTKGITALLGKDCEVVLHSFMGSQHSIIAIENGEITNRKIGSSLTNSGLEILNKAIQNNKEIVGPYKGISPAGIPLRSVTIPIRNRKGKLIASLCLNMNLTAVISLDEFLKPLTQFTENKTLSKDISKNTSHSTIGLMKKIFDEVAYDTSIKNNLPTSQKNKLIVKKLCKRQFFQIKNSVEFIANKLNVSQFTIYNYIREIKKSEGKGGNNGKKHH